MAPKQAAPAAKAKPKPKTAKSKAKKAESTQSITRTIPPEFVVNKWQPGQSGNPGGRRKEDKSVKALARQFTAEAIQTLAEIMQDKDAATASRVAAASTLLDRGHGKPLQQLEVGEAGAFSELDDAELDNVIAKMGAQLATLMRDDGESRVVN